MAESRGELERTVAALHTQLAGLSQLDQAARETLETALDDILEALRRPSSEEQPPESLADRLNDTAAEFQESHPGLYNTLTGIIEALARMGI